MEHLELEFTPDDLEIFDDQLVHACYELQDSKRVGKIASRSAEYYRGNGVLDIEVYKERLYGVTSEGELIVIGEDKECYEISNGIGLSLSISNLGMCLISDSLGYLHIFDTNTRTLMQDIKGHSLEVWSCCWQNHANIVSGADDCNLNFWDIIYDNNILCGNYDEKVRIVDSRTPNRIESELDCGGGIWRMKKNPNNDQIWLIAAMHGGAHIVDLRQSQILQTFSKHESMVYGAVWLNQTEVATCSFYDKMLWFWNMDK
eukprot:NODE_221_length_12388_cov_2.350883.p5 type:complete len:259 gc:universal NODE_221_length_12388_cov_2.350883:11395-12171(+)